MTIKAKVNKILNFCSRKWKGLVADVSDAVYGVMQDKMHGVDFFANMEIEETGVSEEKGNRYQATHVRALSFFKKYFKKYPPKGAIIDIGCGKGQMLKFFSGFPFTRVDGLEYSSTVGEIAISNMNKLNLSCRVFIGDASCFEDLDDYNYFYLFNPFPQPVVEKFIENLNKSTARKQRDITVFYLTPVCYELFINNGFTGEKTKCRGLVILRRVQGK